MNVPIEMPMPEFKPPVTRPTCRVIFVSADDMWRAFQDYRNWTKQPDNRLSVGSRGRTVPRPMTISGFSVYLGCGRATLYRAADREDLCDVWERIRDAIADDLVAGGLVKNFDGMLVARVTALADHQKVETTDQTPAGPEYDYSLLTTDELEILTELLAKCQIDG